MAKFTLGEVEAPSCGSSQAGDFSVPSFPGFLKHSCDVPVFTFLFPDQP